MEQELKEWLLFLARIVALLTLIILGIVGCNVHANYMTLQAIRAGATPIQASVAFSPGGDKSRALAVIEHTINAKKGCP